MMPGTPVVVCKNDKVIVDVLNAMQADTTSLHFHGKYQLNNSTYYGIIYIQSILEIKTSDFANFLQANIFQMATNTLMGFHL